MNFKEKFVSLLNDSLSKAVVDIYSIKIVGIIIDLNACKTKS